MDNKCVKYMYYQDPTWQRGVMYGPDMDCGYVCTVTLTSEMSPWVMDNNCVKYNPDRSSE